MSGKRGGTPSQPWWRALLTSGFVPPLLALAVWSPVLTHGLLWDDPVILERQLPGLDVGKIFAPPTGLYQWTYHYYRPVTLLSLLLDHTIHGTHPFGYHLTVLLLHAAAVWAVFALARRITTRRAAVLGASLFAVFPASAECVGWIAGRNDILAGLFSTLAAAAFLAALGFGKDDPSTPQVVDATAGGASPAPRLAISGVLFLLALLSKESAVGLTPVLLVAGWAAGLRGRRLIAAGIAVLAPIVVMLAMRRLLDPHASGETFAAGPLTPVQAVLWTAAFFPLHLLVPFVGAVYRLAPPMSGATAACSLAIVAAGAVLVARGGRRRPDLLLPGVWVVSAIAAAAAAAAWNVTRTPVADRYFYLPAVGWCVLLAVALAGGPGRAIVPGAARDEPAPRSREPRGSKSERRRLASLRSPETLTGDVGASRAQRIGLAIGWSLVLVFTVSSLIRRPVYADDRAFWTAAARAEPDSGAALMNLGNVLARDGDLEGARSTYRRALETTLSGTDRSLALTDLGSVLYQMADAKQEGGAGLMAEAEGILRSAASMDGAGATAAFNLGAFLYQKGMERLTHRDFAGSVAPIEEARPWLERAVAQDASHVRAWTLLGHCYASEGRTSDARAAYERAIRIDGREGEIGREAAAGLERLGRS